MKLALVGPVVALVTLVSTADATHLGAERTQACQIVPEFAQLVLLVKGLNYKIEAVDLYIESKYAPEAHKVLKWFAREIWNAKDPNRIVDREYKKCTEHEDKKV